MALPPPPRSARLRLLPCRVRHCHPRLRSGQARRSRWRAGAREQPEAAPLWGSLRGEEESDDACCDGCVKGVLEGDLQLGGCEGEDGQVHEHGGVRRCAKFARNKAEGFFVACGILKKLCESKESHEIARSLQHHIRRLGNLVHDLEKKVELDRRNGRTGVRKEDNLRRLGEAATLYHLLTNDRRYG